MMKPTTSNQVALALGAITVLLTTIMLIKGRPEDPAGSRSDSPQFAPLDVPRPPDAGAPSKAGSRLEASPPGTRSMGAFVSQPPSTQPARVGRIPITDLPRVDAQYVNNVHIALTKSRIPINLRELDLPLGVWTELAALGQRSSRDLYQLEKERGPLMTPELDRLRESGQYLEFKSYDLASDPRERSRLREEFAAAAQPSSDLEQVSIGGGGGKTRVYKVTPLPGTELFRVVADQRRCLRNTGESAAALVLPFIQRPHSDK